MKYSSQSMDNEKVHVAWMRKQNDFVFDIATLYFSALEKLYIMLWGWGGGSFVNYNKFL